MGDPLRLYGLKAIVTNAGSGVGEAVARTLVKHGAKVLAVDFANSGVEQQFASIKGVAGCSESYTDPGRLPALIEVAVDKLGGIDILVTDFALPTDGPIESDGDTESYRNKKRDSEVTRCPAFDLGVQCHRP